MAEQDSKAPAYLWYARDFAADEPVQLMTLEEEGAYRRLLDHQWLHGSIPADVESLARICKNIPKAKMKKLWAGVAPCFAASDGDASRLRNGRLERERVRAQEYRDKQSTKGKAGAVARWGDNHKDSTGNSAGNTSANGAGTVRPMPADGIAVCSLQFACATALNQSSSGREMLAEVMGKIPAEYHADVGALLDRVPSPITWLGEISASLNGMDSHFAATGAQAGEAARDFNGNGAEPNLRRFRAFLRRASEPTVVRPSGNGSRVVSRFAPASDTTKAIIAERVARGRTQ